MFKPLLPLISDALSHDFNEAIHISTVHAIYGDNHVENEMAAASKDEAGKNGAGIKYEAQTPVHLSGEAFSIASIIKTNSITPALFRLLQLATVYLSQPLPPPKFSC